MSGGHVDRWHTKWIQKTQIHSLLPLMSTLNSSWRIFFSNKSIFKVSNSVKRNLCSSYRPRVVYRNTSKVKYSMIFWIRLAGIGDACERAMEMSNRPRNCLKEVWYITLTYDISTIRKYRILPRVATGEEKRKEIRKNVNETMSLSDIATISIKFLS